MVVNRRPLNVRLPSEIHEMIEAAGGKKQDVVESALRAYFDSSDDSPMLHFDNKKLSDDSSDNGSSSGDDSCVIAVLTEQIAEKDRQIAELHVMLHDAISPQAQLPAADSQRKWWQLWRKA